MRTIPASAFLLSQLSEHARNVRIRCVRMVSKAGASHIGSSLSIVEILVVLYFAIMVDSNSPESENRDRLLLSKGHACVALYSTLCELNVIGQDLIDSYGESSSTLMAHASHHVRGVEFSSGSLGHGLPFGVGKALAARLAGKAWRTFVVMSDGELDEGSNWEALLFAAHHRLGNLTAIVDCNGLQSLGTVESTLNIEPLAEKFKAFGWEVLELDGHDLPSLFEALSRTSELPLVVLARTVKGKGVSFMENQVAWHYQSPSPSELDQAETELLNRVSERNDHA
jgi:transketolase